MVIAPPPQVAVLNNNGERLVPGRGTRRPLLPSTRTQEVSAPAPAQQPSFTLTQYATATLRAETRRQQRVQQKQEVQDMAKTALHHAQRRHAQQHHAQERHAVRMQRPAHASHSQEDIAMTPCTPGLAAAKLLTIRQLMNNDYSRRPVLSREEEASLAHAMHNGTSAQEGLEALGKERANSAAARNVTGIASQPPQVRHLLDDIHAGAVAKRKLIQASSGLVFKIVTPYLKQQLVPVEDLLMAGMDGLRIGVQKFDPARGTRLSTVAYMWASQAVRGTFREMAAGIWVPAKARADANKVVAAQQQYSGSIQSNPEVLEKIRHQLGLTEIGFTNALRALKMQEFSLDSSPITSTPSGKEQQGDSHLDSIAAPEAVSVDDDANHAEVAVQEALQQLPGAEASFIQHMYGLQTGVALKRKQVAQVMGISDYRARKIEQQALRKLRSISVAQGGLAHQP